MVILRLLSGVTVARKIPDRLSLSCFGDSRALLPVLLALPLSLLLCPSLLLPLLSSELNFLI